MFLFPPFWLSSRQVLCMKIPGQQFLNYSDQSVDATVSLIQMYLRDKHDDMGLVWILDRVENVE